MVPENLRRAKHQGVLLVKPFALRPDCLEMSDLKDPLATARTVAYQ